ncbi:MULTISPECIES: hypothetical protein [unclassified Bacillus (in: firmicutes)]|uniref:hypothetical protein n=1 Tax=unclassified Bacillus (in: firmicutes) TaxID=185979 RepID=UPI0008DFF422|nr:MULTISPECIES: hypothetical protein [unclassified Bacillus (in: firmicutes)]SFA99602.1 hypothetical protein SAMN02799634_103454 [Bacillus sp. UNCCL13]SFQ81723.1 hypothetical protein SAMN04488577_2085 [Bacillus sp. cl95]
MKKTNITLITLAIVITVFNQFVYPIFFDMQPDSLGTGLSIIFVASALLNHLREN